MDSNQALQERIALIKLKRIELLNDKLIESLSRNRIPASNASYLILSHIEETKDYLVPCLHVLPIERNKYAQYKMKRKSAKATGCCTIV